METRQLIKNKDWVYQKYILEDLKNSDIARLTGITRKGVEYWLKKHKIVKFLNGTKYPIDESKINSTIPEFMYFVGLFMADGTMNRKNNRVTIKIKDIEPLTAIKKYFKTDVPISVLNDGYHEPSYELRLSSKVLAEYMGTFYTKNKTQDVIWPIASNAECFKMLLRGFIDGDGSIEVKSYSNAYFRFGSASCKLVSKFKDEYTKYFPEHPINEYAGKVKSNKYFQHLEIRCGFNSLIELYQEYPNFSIKRKRDKIKLLIDDIVQTYGIINHKRWG